MTIATVPRDAVPRDAVRRIASAFVSAELGRLRRTDPPAIGEGGWPDATPIGDDGLGLDPLERLGALAILAGAFDLDDSLLGREPPRTVGAWIDWIMAAHADGHGRMTLHTSGSTGTPRPCIHAVSDPLAEAAFLAARFMGRRRVVALVPAHYLYGLVWTALLPAALGVAVRTIGAPLGLVAGDPVVAVPDQWQTLRRLIRRFPADIVGVGSAGPLDDGVAAGLLAAGLARLVDIYGSSETGGIAMRDLPGTAYRLLPRWRRLAAGHRRWPGGRAAGSCQRLGDRTLRPIGRRDGTVQIGGHNIWPERVAEVLKEIDGVADAAVRLDGNGRLAAFIVPDDGRTMPAFRPVSGRPPSPAWPITSAPEACALARPCRETPWAN